MSDLIEYREDPIRWLTKHVQELQRTDKRNFEILYDVVKALGTIRLDMGGS